MSKHPEEIAPAVAALKFLGWDAHVSNDMGPSDVEVYIKGWMLCFTLEDEGDIATVGVIDDAGVYHEEDYVDMMAAAYGSGGVPGIDTACRVWKAMEAADIG